MASPPLIVTPVPQAALAKSDGPLVDQFIEGYCRVTMESVGGHAGELLRMRSWQHNLTRMLYARRPDGRLRHREALIGLPRKNGKSALASSLALHALVMGPEGSQVFSCASTKDQAGIVFRVAKRMVECDPLLSQELRVWRDSIEYTSNGSVYKVLSAEAPQQEGLNPTVVVYDELHTAPTDELYDVMTLAQGSRYDPLFIAITTAGVKTDQTGQDSICYRRYQYGEKVANGEIEDPSFFMAWWGAPQGADYKDPAVWAAANPGFDDLIDPDDFRAVLGRVSENAFRTKRLNQWVSSTEAWLPQGAWNACRNERDFVPSRRGVVLGFDGSRNSDSTALVAVTVDQYPQLIVLGMWERPPGPRKDDWKVPRAEVLDCIRKACQKWNVREIACDEFGWLSDLDELIEEGLPVVAFPQTMIRMAPATQRFYELVMTEKIGHDGDKRLARHLDQAILKTDQRGSRLIKDKPDSPRKVDGAIASVMAVDRAAFWLGEPIEGSYIWKDVEGVQHHKPVSEIKFVW